tara:strand:+ start:1470 stop:1643 length:174 start_codon:yes stop_codon:yes gene_type:complete
MMRVVVEWQDQFRRWHRYTEMNHQASAYRTAERRASSTGKRHRLVDADGHLLDLVDP